MYVCMYIAMRQLLQQLVDGGGHLGPNLSPEIYSLRTDTATMIEVGRLCEVARAVSITTCSVLGSFLSQVLMSRIEEYKLQGEYLFYLTS